MAAGDNQTRREATKQRYLDEAEKLIFSGQFTMQALARNMDAAVGTAYAYFSDRDAIVSAVLLRYAEEHQGGGTGAVNLALTLFEQGNPDVVASISMLFDWVKSADYIAALELVLSKGGKPHGR